MSTTEEATATGNHPVIVELFTSQGCSSCPPADEALIDLVDRTERNGNPVYALSFHVDHWNRLGWKDPFSPAEWSERQRVYATRTGDRVYTPQSIVNGTKSFVGSRSAELNHQVDLALSKASSNTVQAHAQRTAGSIMVEATVTGAVANKELMVALVEDGLSSQVVSGENKGRRLSHAHVVRVLESVPIPTAQMPIKLELNASSLKDPMKARVIVFVQEEGQGAITGAAQALIE